MKGEIFVIGVGMTRFGRHAEGTVKSLVAEAVSAALADADCRTEQIDAAYFANTTQSILEGQHLIRGQVALRESGFSAIPVVNVENACASGSSAFHQAAQHLLSGAAEVVLAIGVEKMFHPDRAKSAAIFDGGWDVHQSATVIKQLAEIGAGVAVPEGRGAGVNSPFMDLYASLAKGHMRQYGTTERQLAAVAAKNHWHSTMNPLSQYQVDMSIDEVLSAKTIAWPLTLPMCSPISDGASAAVLCTKSALARFASTRPIRVLACVLGSGSDRAWNRPQEHICRRLALKAFEMAGAGPDEISVAEVHDASAFAEIVQTEALGFCEIGAGGWLAEKGETKLGGKIPVNPSGGLESKGHPLGATGLAQIYELVQQLRGQAGKRQVDGARLALAENGGGFIGVEEAAAVITILGAATEGSP